MDTGQWLARAWNFDHPDLWTLYLVNVKMQKLLKNCHGRNTQATLILLRNEFWTVTCTLHSDTSENGHVIISRHTYRWQVNRCTPRSMMPCPSWRTKACHNVSIKSGVDNFTSALTNGRTFAKYRPAVREWNWNHCRWKIIIVIVCGSDVDKLAHIILKRNGEINGKWST